jgi:hypothetical protein
MPDKIRDMEQRKMAFLFSILLGFLICPIAYSQSVVIYENPNFGGRSKTIGVGDYRLGSDFNDIASSIKVPKGLGAIIYEHAGDKSGYGISVDLLEDCPDLSKYNLSDKVSYISVFSTNRQGFFWARNSIQNGQFVAGHWERVRASGNPVNTVPVVSPPLPPPPPPFDLTGTWTADDGGVYYLRQLGSTIWWAGLSNDAPQGVTDFQQGLRFTNVFRGTIQDNTIVGTWAGVPRGKSLLSGNLTLRIIPIGFPLGNVLEMQTQTGGFSGKRWSIVIPRNPPPCDSITAASSDIRCKFNRVKKNDGSTLYDNLKPEKDNVVVFGNVSAPPLTVAYPNNAGRNYPDFIKTWNGGDGSYDGDVDFNTQIDRIKLDAQPNFWNKADGWLYPSINGIIAKLNGSQNAIHCEAMMYGRTEGGRQALLPGWNESGANSVLWNGSPMNGFVGPLPVGTRVRITGVLVLDCGHCDFPYTSCHDCADNDAEPNNLEIHPVYSIDVLQNFDPPRPNADLTGVWAATDVGTYYVRQVGNTVWWLGLSRDRGQTFANIFQGTIQQGTTAGEKSIIGDWADIPLGVVRSSGTISLRSDHTRRTDSPTTLNKINFTGGFGAQRWEKLYDRLAVEVPERCKVEKANLANLQRSLKENQAEIRRLESAYSRAPAQEKQAIQLDLKDARATGRELLQQISKAEQLLRLCLSRPALPVSVGDVVPER